MIMFDPDLVIIITLLIFALVTMAVVQVGSDLGGMGVLLIVLSLIFGWPFAVIGAILLLAHANNKRKNI